MNSKSNNPTNNICYLFMSEIMICSIRRKLINEKILSTAKNCCNNVKKKKKSNVTII